MTHGCASIHKMINRFKKLWLQNLGVFQMCWIPHAITKLQWIYIYSVKVVWLMCGACLGNLVQRGMERGPHACSNSSFTPIQQLQHHGLDCWWCMWNLTDHLSARTPHNQSLKWWNRTQNFPELSRVTATWLGQVALSSTFFFLGLILCTAWNLNIFVEIQKPSLELNLLQPSSTSTSSNWAAWSWSGV